jgi:hypothetical protein
MKSETIGDDFVSMSLHIEKALSIQQLIRGTGQSFSESRISIRHKSPSAAIASRVVGLAIQRPTLSKKNVQRESGVLFMANPNDKCLRLRTANEAFYRIRTLNVL